MVLDQDNKVQPRVVKTSRAIGDKWQVIEGLEAGDRLIVDGLQRAKPGSVVEPVPFTGDQVIAPAQVESEKTDSSSNTPSVAKKAE